MRIAVVLLRRSTLAMGAGLLAALALLGAAQPRTRAATPMSGARPASTQSAGLALAPQQELDAARAAAVAAEGADTFSSAADCQAHVPEGKCLTADSTPEQAASGIAYFGVNVLDDGGWGDVVGRAADGTWHYYFGGQQFDPDMVNLPQAVQVCADGDGLNVRSAPDVTALVVGVLSDGTVTTADQFLLTAWRPDPRSPSAPYDSGWYHLTGELDGWVSAPYLATTASVAVYYGCLLHYP